MKLIWEANKTSSYGPLLKDIFKDKADLLYYPEIEKDIELTITRLKYKLLRLGVFDSTLPIKGRSIDYNQSPNSVVFRPQLAFREAFLTTSKAEIQDELPATVPPRVELGEVTPNFDFDTTMAQPNPLFRGLTATQVRQQVEREIRRGQQTATGRTIVDPVGIDLDALTQMPNIAEDAEGIFNFAIPPAFARPTANRTVTRTTNTIRIN